MSGSRDLLQKLIQFGDLLRKNKDTTALEERIQKELIMLGVPEDNVKQELTNMKKALFDQNKLANELLQKVPHAKVDSLIQMGTDPLNPFFGTTSSYATYFAVRATKDKKASENTQRSSPTNRRR